MKIFQLINAMEALAEPQVEVLFYAPDGQVYAVEGGLLDTEEGTGRRALLLSPVSVVTEGGF